MKFALVLVVCSTLVVAAPTWNDKQSWKDESRHHWEEKHKEWNDDHADWTGDHKSEHKDIHAAFPFEFTSILKAYAGPDQVVNNSQVAVPGLEKGFGMFQFGLNSHEDVICYNISVYIKGNYSSPAVTATHIHQAPKGRAGPPRIAFPNPQPHGNTSLDEYAWRYSLGCLQGPFKTGIVNNGTDTGAGFTVKDLEDTPWEFFADTHTADFPAGAIRGQIYGYNP
ncbi:hypothetical protein BD324DRAFT_81552 [Kockovaella imperatae]|uniref:CHRD domain-containing protein n=1 Tax=Kockovaella imperatae TaxID=4999 RepID=A0A1Y1UB00_9TREE|nr:hypothetical protein BD324DRAFT_81552 [Kockovaella imperatae]ORX35213.1 hypothetical protein BD324DRAFT_81552 [Kockovaella imperatae]